MSETTFNPLPANAAALGRSDPALLGALRGVTPAGLRWGETADGHATASLESAEPGGRAVGLCSKYDPVGEAERLLAGIDYGQTGCVVLIGLGLGYAAERAAAALGRDGLLVVYEPDAALLAAVLQRRDLSGWLGQKNVRLFAGPVCEDETEPDATPPAVDRAAVLSRCETAAHLLTQGTQLVTLPTARKLHAESAAAFGRVVADVVAYCRTNIATALVNASRTCRNLANNLDVYAAGATTNELEGAAEGRVAVCVGAGPSLVKNVDLLRDPAVRRNVVVIAVQTALRPLLDRGVRPDFVTALDYSPICARFYEGLPELPDVTLVAEPKAHPAILDAFPGPVRVCNSGFNDQLLGDPRHRPEGMARPVTPIRGGATVAHLSYYLARHLGCDPVVLIGQDLGFSDGLYYAPGTAVHRVWGCELGPFNTIETMEWQRIVRMRGHLRRFDDVHGRPIFSDEQMLTYLKQFERDFAADTEAGLTVIDATEGGMPKRHTTRLTLAETLERHATEAVPALPAAPRGLDPDRLGRLDALLRRRLDQVADLRQMSQRSVRLIEKMRGCLERDDKRRLDRHFEELSRNRSRVEGDLKEPFALVNQLNTVGAFRRSRADRAIAQEAKDPREKLARQLDRDGDNLAWIVSACDEAQLIFAEALERVRRHGPPRDKQRAA
ncbi:MAG: 6-hydroxymethylpterin diphosphokinase MptE-like protein [Planctomycetota bacterium]